MSRLEYLAARPLVAFDPASRDHRRHWHQFLESGSWGACPVRFILLEEHGSNLPAVIHRVLVQYYLALEFRPKRARVPATAASFG